MSGLGGRPDAVVVGAGPNGLAGALRLAAAGLRVQVVERADRPGGGLRTEELTRPGYRHDMCSTVQSDGRRVAVLPGVRPAQSWGAGWYTPRSAMPIRSTGGAPSCPAARSRRPRPGWGRTRPPTAGCSRPPVEHGDDVIDFFLTSSAPAAADPQRAAGRAVGPTRCRTSGGWLERHFDGEEAKALIAGAAAHGMLDLTRPLTAGLGMILGMLAHHVGWPLIEGGSQALADAMVTALEEQGGELVTGHEVTDLREFEGVPAVLLDTTPGAFVAMAGDRVQRGLPAVGVALQARPRGVQGRLGAVGAGALDQPRRPAGRHAAPGRHAGGDPRRGGGPRGRKG